MKKILAIVLAVVMLCTMAFSLSACSSAEDDGL